MARAIDADAFREWWLENGENEYVYDTNAFLDSIDNWPTLTPPNEPLTCEGCACKEYSRDSYPCNSCFRNDETLSDQYRPPEEEA